MSTKTNNTAIMVAVADKIITTQANTTRTSMAEGKPTANMAKTTFNMATEGNNNLRIINTAIIIIRASLITTGTPLLNKFSSHFQQIRPPK